jgi:diguanylate cyclase (GGDEF)-like protein
VAYRRDDQPSIVSHAEGAAVQARTTITGNIRATDTAARLGGDEFAVLLPESDAASVKQFFHKLHRILIDVVQKKNWPVTFSFGVVTFIMPPASIDDMIRIVDRLMYSAKNSGKNLVKYEVFEK